MTFPPLVGDGNAAIFPLRLIPNAVDCVCGRVIPVARHACIGIDDRQPIVRVHRGPNDMPSIPCAVLGVNVEQ